MPIKGSGSAEMEVIDRFDDGVGWIAHPEETMSRASHAVVSDGELWVLDPVDAAGVDDLLAEFGEVAGVVTLLDRHKRDSAAIANRHDVSVFVPQWMSGVTESLDAPTERFGDRLAGFEVEPLVDNPIWQEAVLFDGETLVVPEALGTVEYFRASSESLGVHPMLRMVPPRSLRGYDPERLLVGHGEGVFEDVPASIRTAIKGSRSKAPSMYLKSFKQFLGFG
jgi:hypothetical protein